jgi:hypothetical protein
MAIPRSVEARPRPILLRLVADGGRVGLPGVLAGAGLTCLVLLTAQRMLAGHLGKFIAPVLQRRCRRALLAALLIGLLSAQQACRGSCATGVQ